MNLIEAEKLASTIDENLLATDERFKRSVTVRHIDGSVLSFVRAFALKSDNVYLIFTEHHRTWVFFQEDVELTQHGPSVAVEGLNND